LFCKSNFLWNRLGAHQALGIVFVISASDFLFSVKANAATASTSFVDYTSLPSDYAIQFSKSRRYSIDVGFGLFDGEVKNKQADSKRIDRRLSSHTGLEVDSPLVGPFSLRIGAIGETIRQRQVESLEPQTIIDSTTLTLYPVSALTYVTPAGLEIYGGLSGFLQPTHTQVIKSELESATSKHSNAVAYATHFGVTRRGGSGAAGFTYQLGKQSTRTVKKEASDGSTIDLNEAVHLPTTISIYAQFDSAGAKWTILASSLSAGEGGERAESGSSLRDDYLKFRLTADLASGFQASVGYQTASYSKSAYIDLDSIPIITSKLAYVIQDQGRRVFVGPDCKVGRDKQSIPEVNAEYKVNACALIGGIYGSL
ncbi:MAG: hypothetical protein NT027_12860, partial [Proteobacteria bacterium]|nr:hypothetical protein [Pseudomonadota bacterium]